MKRLIEFSTISMFIGLAGGAQGANELELSNIPLFLGDSVVPNVYIEMDDSGSMDLSILTRKYYYYQTYWDNGSYSHSLVDSGYWDAYSDTGICKGRQNNTYIYNNADNIYYDGSECGWGQPVKLGVNIYDHPEAIVRDWRVRSAAFNVMYYDPAVTYTPWLGAAELPDAGFTNARSNPIEGEAGYTDTRDLTGLTGFVYEVWNDTHGFNGTIPQGPASANGTPNGWVDLWDQHTRYTVKANSITVETFSSNFGSASGECKLTDAEADLPYETCFGATREVSSIDDPKTIAAIKQNIANWYQYSRRRSFVAKGALGAVIDELSGFRYGLSVINEYSSLTVDLPPADVLDFTDHNSDLLERLYSFDWQRNNTPLRKGLKRVGEYYKQNGASAPVCQQNFTVLLTDGYWNGLDPSPAPGDVDKDHISNTLADVARYYYPTDLQDPNPTNQHMVTFTVAFGIEGNLKDTDGDGDPDQDADGDTFPTDPNEAAAANWGNPSGKDPIPQKVDDLWHAAFNSSGSFVAANTPQEMLDALLAALQDVDRRSGSAAAVALNSGSLGNDTHLYQARFNSSSWSGQLLAFPINPDGSVATAPVWDAGEMIEGQSEQKRVILSYDPATKTGIKFRYETIEAIEGDDPQIKSQSQMAALMTGAPNALPTPLDPPDPNFDTEFTTQFDANKDYVKALVNYLRGERIHEGEGDNTEGFRFRVRAGKLGDVVHSSPVYVGSPSFRYPDRWRDNLYPEETQPENGSGKEYSVFRNKYSGLEEDEVTPERTPMIYFGANDGMLHGINATDHDDGDDTTTSFSEGGAELLAYVPSMLYERLPELASSDYIHRYYVDGGPTVVDAFVGSSGDLWRTVLVGGLGGGGQGIYALDVTNPAHSSIGFSEDNASNIVMWEFSDADDADLGYSYSKPAIVRLHNGKWAAVFGNGYNNTEADGNASTTGNAVLYIVDLKDRSILKIDTLVGAEQDPTNNVNEPTAGHRPNGLATAAPVDLDGDGIVDYIYAGDLFGNLWKFDVTSNLTTNWEVASFGGSKKPLFKAVSTEGEPQPITSRPEVGHAPQGKPGVMVYFGTGQYLEPADNTLDDQETQTFYGIWDNWEAVELVRGEYVDIPQKKEALQKQEIELEQQQTFLDGTQEQGDFDVRASTANDVDWSLQKGWYMDLVVQDPPGNQGERQVTPSVLRNNRIIFTTLQPSSDPCAAGGDSWLMALDAVSGARLPFSPFDLNQDGVFDMEDYAEPPDSKAKMPASGVKSKVGIISAPGIITDSTVEHAYTSGTDGSGPGNLPDMNPGKGDYGRQSWREL